MYNGSGRGNMKWLTRDLNKDFFCGSISIMRAVTHNLCLRALTFVCNSTYLLKCSFEIYQKSIVVFIRSSKV